MKTCFMHKTKIFSFEKVSLGIYHFEAFFPKLVALWEPNKVSPVLVNDI